MTQMSKKIFYSILLTSGIVLISMLVCVTAVMYRFYSQQYIDSLTNEAYCISAVLKIGDEEYLSSIETNHRITLIEPDGTVSFDNETELSVMGNHSDRAEVKDALENGTGVSERFSTTLSEKTVNVAILLDDGSVLRISDVQKSILSIIISALLPVLCVFILAAVLAMYIAARVAKSITAPINNIDLSAPQSSTVYAELAPFVERITKQNQQIALQMDELKAEHERQDSMRRDFTANVSHELKTPLTSISGYAEIIREGIVKPEDVRRFSGKIYDESQRLITLVGDIIKLSQLDDSEMIVSKDKIDLYALCEDVISHLELAAAERNVQIELSGPHLIINGMEQIVEEIVFNLCDNAIKYNHENGKVWIKLCQYVDGVELTVSDTGIGIPEADLDHIFERFYRVDKSHSKEIGGTGLGLSIVKHGAKTLGASVSVKSIEGEGTTVRVLF